MTYDKLTSTWSMLLFCLVGCDNSNDVARTMLASIGGSTPQSQSSGGTPQSETSPTSGVNAGGNRTSATGMSEPSTGGAAPTTSATGGSASGGAPDTTVTTGGANTGGVAQGGTHAGGATQGTGGSSAVSCADPFASRSIAVGSMPGGVVSHDLNGDGHRDLAVTSTYDNTLRVLVGDGHGNLATGNTLLTGIDPEYVVSDDVNRDGIPDLVVTNLGDDNVGVFLGTGGGEYAVQVTSPIGNEPMSIRTADMNHDGNPDVIVGSLNSSGSSSGFSVALGKGDGTFETPTDYSTGGQRTFVEVADFDEDGHPDVAAASNTAMVTIHYGDGTGAVTPGASVSVAGGPIDMKATDVDNDGRLDLLVANEDAHSVSVLLARGPRSYLVNQVPVEGWLTNLAVADINNDQIVDQLVATSRGILLLTGKGDGTFDWIRAYPAGIIPGQLTTADLDEDGRVDLALTLTPFPSVGEAGYVDVLLNDGAGSLIGNEYHSTDNWPVTVLLEDLTGDGWPDLLQTGSIGANVVMLPGLGNGMLSDWPQRISSYPSNAGGFDPPMLVADFNQDGLRDIATQHSPTIDVYYNHQGAQLTLDVTLPLSSVTGLASADLDNNGYPDIVATQGNADRLSVILNGGSEFLDPAPYSTGDWPSKVAIADMDADSVLDVVVANYSEGTVGLYRGIGAGVLAVPTVFEANVRPLFLRVADLNHDALPDVIVDDRDANRFAVLLNQGGGTLATGVAYATSDAPQNFAVADFDGDGTLDLAIPEQYAYDVALFYGRGDGTFLPRVAHPTGYQCTAVVSGDVNKDGKPDLVFAAETQDSLVVMLNRRNCQ